MSINNNIENINKILIQLDKEKNLKKKTELFNNGKKIITDCKNELVKIEQSLNPEIKLENNDKLQSTFIPQ
jgi:exonuclease VII small subunit